MKRKSPQLLAHLGRRLTQLVGAELLADVDDFLNHVPAACDDDDENASATEWDELDAIEHRRLVRWTDCEPDAAGGLREHVRNLRQNRVEQAVGAVTPETRLDRVGRAGWSLGLEQEIHVEAVPAVRRDASGRGVRLLDVALFLEPRQDVPDRRRRHTQPGRCHEQ